MHRRGIGTVDAYNLLVMADDKATHVIGRHFVKGLFHADLCRDLILVHRVCSTPGYREHYTSTILGSCPPWAYRTLVRAREVAWLSFLRQPIYGLQKTQTCCCSSSETPMALVVKLHAGLHAFSHTDSPQRCRGSF
jgi:hypothetical protein